MLNLLWLLFAIVILYNQSIAVQPNDGIKKLAPKKDFTLLIVCLYLHLKNKKNALTAHFLRNVVLIYTTVFNLRREDPPPPGPNADRESLCGPLKSRGFK